MKRLMLPSILITGLSIAFLLASPNPNSVNAIEGGGIGGVPANPRDDNPRSKSIFVYKLDKGTSVDDALQVVNNTPSAKTLLVYAVDSQIASGGAFTCGQKADKPIAAGLWVKLSNDRVTVGPNSTKKVDFKVSVPKDAAPGEQNACIVIQDANSAPVDQGNGINLSFRSAIRVAITIPGEITKGLDFTGFSVEKLNDDRLRMSASLRNNGNVSLDSNVTAKLKTLFGGTVRSAGGDFPVLAGSEAKFNFEVDKVFWGGWYKAQASAEYNSDTSQAIGEGQNNQKIDSKEVIIFVPPQPAALAIEVAVLVVAMSAVAYFLLRRRYYQQLSARSKNYTVKKGDTINSVAKSSGISWKRLAKLNGLKAPYTLKQGDKIKVPSHKQQ